MTAENYIKARLAALAHREAAHLGGLDNMRAVAFVIRNRVRAGWHGGQWMAVMDAHYDYAAMRYPPEPVDLREMNFRLLLSQIDDIYVGAQADNMTEGALFYAELHRVESQWFKANVLGDGINHPRIAQVGQVVLFK